MIRNEGVQEGRLTGQAEGRAESIKELLSDLGPLPENIITQIDGEKDQTTLSRWLKLAAKADSIEEFMQNM